MTGRFIIAMHIAMEKRAALGDTALSAGKGLLSGTVNAAVGTGKWLVKPNAKGERFGPFMRKAFGVGLPAAGLYTGGKHLKNSIKDAVHGRVPIAIPESGF